MREIIFRGKRVYDSAWVYGSFIPDLCELLYGNKLDGFIKPFGKIRKERLMVEVDRKTVGQYTGLTDKNGTKIFEGDILSGHLDELFPEDESRYPVVWHDYGWHIKCGNKSFDTLEQWWVAKFLEVIGNIHDNPELLERGAKNE